MNDLYAQYSTSYPDASFVPKITTQDDTAQQRVNILFENFMNNRTGFGLKASDYLAFMEQCGDTVYNAPCVSCDSLQSLINKYFAQTNIYGGSESGMLSYIQNQLAANGLNIDTNRIKTALFSCGNSWQQNVAFHSDKMLAFKGEDAPWDTPTLGHNLDIGKDGANFTIEFWTNLNSNQAGWQYLLVYGASGRYPDFPGAAWYPTTDTSSTYGYKGYTVAYANGQLYFGMSDVVSSNNYVCRNILVRTPITTGQWHHIVVTRTGTGKYITDLTIYIDDVLSTLTSVHPDQGCNVLSGNGSIAPGAQPTLVSNL